MPEFTNPNCPLVTVLIGTYNYGRFLGRAVESALAQTYPPSCLEVLVIDDGSTDNTPEVVRQYGDRARYVRRAHRGQASALNEGIRQARGDIICLLDADDYFYPEKVRCVVEAFRDAPEVGLVYNNFNIVDNDGNQFREFVWDRTWTYRKVTLSKVPAQLRSLILLGHPWSSMTSAISLRKAVIEGLEVPEDVFVHSADLFLSIVLPFMAEVRIIESPPLTAYVFHGQNIVLYRSSQANRETHRHHVAWVQRYVKDHFGTRFVTYFGRSVYGPALEAEWQRKSRASVYRADLKQIAAADVDWTMKLESQLRLLAGFLLPLAIYDRLRHLRAALRRLLKSPYAP